MVVVNAHVQDQHIWRLPYIMGGFSEKKKKKKKKKSLFSSSGLHRKHALKKKNVTLLQLCFLHKNVVHYYKI